MEILDKCVFHDLNNLIQFKKYSVFDFGLKQSDENSAFFDKIDPSFKVSIPSSINLGYFVHVILENGFDVAYQRFLMDKLSQIDKNNDKPILTNTFNSKKLVLIFDLNTAWRDGITNEKDEIMNYKLKQENDTFFLRIPYLDIINQQEEFLPGDVQNSFISFLQKNFTDAQDIDNFFNELNISTTEYHLSAVIIDNLSMLSIYEEPQNIELMRLRRPDNSKDNELVMMDFLKDFYHLFGCLVITIGFNI
ncbi:hypothetical protein ACO0SA_002150 [Hanseniaspora valbyensis]